MPSSASEAISANFSAKVFAKSRKTLVYKSQKSFTGGCQPRIRKGDFSGKVRESFFEYFFGFACFLFDLLHLNFFGNFEREQFVGVPFDTVLEIAERLIRSHFEVVEFSCCFVELSPKGGKIVVGRRGWHGESREKPVPVKRESANV